MRNVISIGYGRHLFEARNPERERLVSCAQTVSRFDMVIFSNRRHGLQMQSASPTLHLHPTNSRNNIWALVDAFLITRALVKQAKAPVTLTTQDPFETACIGLLLKKLYGVKLIIQEHGDFFGGPHWRRESVLNCVRYFFGLWVLRHADVVRVVSKRTKAHLQQKKISHIEILPVAIDTALYQSTAVSPLVREVYAKGTFVFLSAARFVPQKNLTLLLQAFFDAQQLAPHIRLLLVGQGSEQATIERLIKERTSEGESLVHILPWSPDVASLMRASDAYVLSSNYEGWGRVLIEAMLSKLPIVTTAVGCAEEVVQDTVHGLIVPVADREALKKALLTIATDHRQYQKIKQSLATLVPADIPGTNSSAYAAQWERIFGR